MISKLQSTTTNTIVFVMHCGPDNKITIQFNSHFEFSVMEIEAYEHD
jgi:hypothetical protein